MGQVNNLYYAVVVFILITNSFFRRIINVSAIRSGRLCVSVLFLVPSVSSCVILFIPNLVWLKSPVSLFLVSCRGSLLTSVCVYLESSNYGTRAKSMERSSMLPPLLRQFPLSFLSLTFSFLAAHSTWCGWYCD